MKAVSSQFLDRYLEMLDPQHIHFTQADLAEFEPYRTNLNHLTLPSRRPGDTTPACEIFNRFVERLEQRTAYADDLLKHEKFTFDTDERITINRKGLPYPANLDEAKKLWRERLRFEYLAGIARQDRRPEEEPRRRHQDRAVARRDERAGQYEHGGNPQEDRRGGDR